MGGTFFNRAGGWPYHWAAARFRRSIWQSHIEATGQWLEDWRPRAREIVLIGPSSGYSLPLSYFSRFAHIHAVDPDPFAALHLRWKFRGQIFSWHRENYLTTPTGHIWPQGLGRLKQQFPGAAFLFCNILGQIGFLARDFAAELGSFRRELEKFCASTEWASYHDLWSMNAQARAPAWQPPPVGGEDRLRLSLQHFLKMREVMEVRDHLTGDLFDSKVRRTLWLWQIRPRVLHCIEGVRPEKQEL